MKFCALILVFAFCFVFEAKAVPVSFEDAGEINESNIRLRRAYNYERNAPDSNSEIKKELLVLRLVTQNIHAESTTVSMNPVRMNNENSVRTTQEDPKKTPSEEQIRTSNNEQIKTSTEEQIKITTDNSSSDEQKTVETKSKNY